MKLNVLLIHPNIQGDVGLNLGLAHIVSSIESRGGNVRLVDFTFAPADYRAFLAEQLKGYTPAAIGFSTPTFYFSDSLKIAKLLRELYPSKNIPFIWGGIHPTLLPEETIAQSLVDAICIGEGEITIQEYLDRLEAGREPRDVAGIWYKDSNNNIIKNPLRPFEENLDSLPFPNWDHWQIDRYTAEVPMLPGILPHILSRGCPYDCTFCTNPAIRTKLPGRYVRHRSAANFIAEIKQNYAKYACKGFKSVYIHDETFGMNKDIFEQFCDLYIAEGLNKKLPFFAQTRADMVTPQWAQRIAAAGCRLIYLGVESANDFIRNKVYNKNLAMDDILNACKYLKDAGILYRLGFVLDTSRATKNIVKEDVRLIKQTETLFFEYPPFTPIPHIQLTQDLLAQNVLQDQNYISHWDLSHFGLNDSEYKKIMRLLRIIKMLKIWLYIQEGIKRNGLRFVSRCFSIVIEFACANNTLNLFVFKHRRALLIRLQAELIVKPVLYGS